MCLYVDNVVEQSQAYARNHCRTGTRAAGQCLAHPALKHAQTDVATVQHLHEPHVHALGKTRAALHLRALLEHGVTLDIVHQ